MKYYTFLSYKDSFSQERLRQWEELKKAQPKQIFYTNLECPKYHFYFREILKIAIFP